MVVAVKVVSDGTKIFLINFVKSRLVRRDFFFTPSISFVDISLNLGGGRVEAIISILLNLPGHPNDHQTQQRNKAERPAQVGGLGHKTHQWRNQ